MSTRSERILQHSDSPERMLGPAAYDESLLPSLRIARSSRFARRVGKFLLWSLVVGFLLVAFAPWQQSVTGSGKVIAFDPIDRQQTIETPIKGKILSWGDNIYENARVEKNQTIVTIQDVDPKLMERLNDQLVASQTKVAAAGEVLAANQRSLSAVKSVVFSLQSQVNAYRSVKEQILASADAAIAGARNKVEAEQKQLEEHQAALIQVEADYQRQKQLYEEEIVSLAKFQLAERKYRETLAKIDKATAYVKSAQNDLAMKQRDRDAKEQKANVDIEYAQATLRKANGDVAKAESDVAKAQSSLSEAQKAVSEMQTKVSRQAQVITAPFDGFITQINPNQGSQILKEGDPLCVIVPDTPDRAVQVWLDGNDAPLVDTGRHVRLQFDGWPAVQFAGWPSVAVGTFGGTVVSVDATDDGKGKFRILVRPDNQRAWPDDRYLKQGVRTNAWVLLEQVPLWYEIWRNMNGFPPVITTDTERIADYAKDPGKKPKLPK